MALSVTSAHTASGIAMNMINLATFRYTYLHMHDPAVEAVGQAGIRLASNSVLARANGCVVASWQCSTS